MAKALYQIRSGETLKSIARDRLRDETRWIEIAYINSIEHPYTVKPGQIILIPTLDSELDILVTKGTKAPVANGGPNLLSPAEWGLFAAGAFFIVWLWQSR